MIRKFSDPTDVFIVDSTPIEICKISRANRTGICRTEDMIPNFGYCAVQKNRYFGYKLHAVCDKNGISLAFDFTSANVHDVNYLKDIKHNFVEFSKSNSKTRKRIETNISQLNGQFSININFAKTFKGLAIRILSKITFFTMIHFLNFFVFNRSLNKIKVNLC